ncbi:hypothetical protein PHMEG_00020808 [Phytophthora megakarya]|uniref:DDE-1 domain-containing protein n=1 Tax=Phytophthora megakarya TaxID=4795 RepID=A0A225VPC7_9STRA|nr:hypothetical protein PHMEG_00020808 [Phytophthora megakarya]
MPRSPKHQQEKALQILESRNSTVVTVAHAVGVDRSTLHRWKKDASRMAASCPNRASSAQARAHVYVQKPELEQKILGWIIHLRIYHLPTANALKVCSCTLCFAFKEANLMFIRRFLKRNRLAFANNLTTPVRLQDVANVFLHSILRTVEEDGILSYLDGPAKYASVYNMDQTEVYIDMNGRTTVDDVGSPTVGVVQVWYLNESVISTVNGFRVSVFLAALATGKKLPPFVVFIGVPGGPVSEEVFNPEFGASTVEHPVHKMHTVMLRLCMTGLKGLLLLDSLKTHKMESVRNTLQQDCCTKVKFVPPPGVTGIFQPMDVFVMKAIKNQVTNAYLQYHINHPFPANLREK